MSLLRSRNSKLQEKIALWEEREKQQAAQSASLRVRGSLPPRPATSSEVVLVPRTRPVVGNAIQPNSTTQPHPPSPSSPSPPVPETKKVDEGKEQELREQEEREKREKRHQERLQKEEEEKHRQAQERKKREQEEENKRREEQERLQKEEQEKARLRQEREARENKAATIIQTRWRTWNAKRKFQVMRKMNWTRTQVAEEILYTEENYVKTLREVVENFVRPLKEAAASGKPIISNDEIKTIFSHIQIILGYNDALLEDLRKKIGSWHPAQMVGDVFLKMAAFMRVYTDYVRNFNDALAMIQECKKSPEFVAFCNDTYPKMSVVQADLSSYLITPVQRIPRYQLLLRDLLKHTWKEHCDHDSLEQALQQITTTAIYVNDKQKEAENIQKMLAIQGSLYGKKLVNLVDPQRRFMREGCLVEINAKGKGKPRWFFLFNDLLVKCNMSNTMKKKTFKKGSTAITFEYIGQLPLEGCELVNSGDEGDKKHGFQVNTSSSCLWLCAASEEEKVEWMKDLKECIRSLKEKSDFYDEHATKIASQRAAAAKALIAEQYTGYRVRGSYSPQSGAKRAEARKSSIGGNNPMEIPEDETDLARSSFRALSAQDRFQLAKQAEQRLGVLLEEEKQQEQTKMDAMNERVKHFKDSMGKRYSSSSETLNSLVETPSDDDDIESSDGGSFIAELNDSAASSPEMSRSGSSTSLVEEDISLSDSGSNLPGKRRFASIKRESYRGSSAGGGSGSRSNTLTGLPKEEKEEGPAGVASKPVGDAPAPKTRKFASLKREDYRSARASRYSGPVSTTPSSLGSSGGDVPLSAAAAYDSEESDVVIHDDAPSTPLPNVATLDRKKNYATGRKRYPSLHTREMGRNSGASGEFGDVADILAQLKTTKEDGSSAKASSSDAGADGKKERKQQKKKKFGSLRPESKKGSAGEEDKEDQDEEGSSAGGAKSKKYSSMKRDEYKAQSAAFGAIELKDMVAAAAKTATGAANGAEAAPKRRFASMKRENYKSFNQPDGDAFDDEAEDASRQ